jgi:translation initiation factor 3 subunit B
VVGSDEDEEEEEIDEFDSGFGNVIVVDNLPVVAPEKYGKLENVISKIFGQMGTIREHGLVMPIDEETQKTKGFAFIEYNTKEVRYPSPRLIM